MSEITEDMEHKADMELLDDLEERKQHECWQHGETIYSEGIAQHKRCRICGRTWSCGE